MPVIKVKIEDFSKVWDHANEEIRKALHIGLLSGALRGQAHLMSISPVDTGLYKASWEAEDIAPGHVMLGNTAPHASKIEYGARPHLVPIGPLLAWAKRVLRDPSQPPSYSPEVWQLARHTQNLIEDHGQEPKHILTNAIPQILLFIREEMKRELNAIG